LDDKISALNDVLQAYGGSNCRTIIFTERKADANNIKSQGVITVDSQVLHGDIPQRQRESTFQAFRSGKLKCLIATDVAARGLDIPEVDLVIQISPPNVPETYIHRSGRTGRAGKKGVCITFYTRKEENLIYKIESEANMRFKRITVPRASNNCNGFGNKAFSKNGPRSMINGAEGLVTYVMESQRLVQSPNEFRDALSECLMVSVLNSIKNVTMLPTKKSVMLDIPSDLKSVFDESIAKFRNPEFKILIGDRYPNEDQNRGFNKENFNDSTGNNFDRSNAFSGSNSLNWGNPDNSSFNGGTQMNSTRSVSGHGNSRRDNGGGNDRPPRSLNSEKDDCKLFIGNLSFDTTESDLQSAISNLGLNFSDCYIVKNSEKASKGFGYVKFSTTEETHSAHSVLQTMRIAGRQVRIDYATKRAN
jgi:superfamily II DNA/RNA helicase